MADAPQANTQRVVVVASGADGLGGTLLEDVEERVFFQALGNKGIFRVALPLRVGATHGSLVSTRPGHTRRGDDAHHGRHARRPAVRRHIAHRM